MGEQFFTSVTTVALAITGVAILAVLVSRNSQTPQVIQAAGSAYSNALGVAISPVTGRSYQLDLSYPSSGYGGFSLGMPAINAPLV